MRARDHTGQTPLHSLCESCRTVDDAVHYIDAAYLLLDNGADQNDIDDQGQTPYDTLSLNVRHTEFGEIVSD